MAQECSTMLKSSQKFTKFYKNAQKFAFRMSHVVYRCGNSTFFGDSLEKTKPICQIFGWASRHPTHLIQNEEEKIQSIMLSCHIILKNKPNLFCIAYCVMRIAKMNLQNKANLA